MRILVTGGRGFLGANLVERFVAEGHKVTVLDNRLTGDNRLGRIVEWDVKGDVRDRSSWGVINGQKYDRIYHAACPASPLHYQRHPLLTIDTAYIGTRNILEFAREWKTRVLLFSTSEVYGDPAVSPQPEAYWGHVNSYGPRAMYDEGKRAGEALAWVYETEFKADVRIARIFNTYGPKMALDDGRMIPEFIRAAILRKPLPIMGSGKQTRSLCYVDDTVEGLVRLMESNVRGPVNIGSPFEMSVKQIAEEVRYAVEGNDKCALNVATLPGAADDPQSRRPDGRRAMDALGWAPEMGLRTGLARTVDWFRSQLGKLAADAMQV